MPFNPVRRINCPQCGDLLPLHFRHSKLAQCASCGAHVFLEDDAARLAGKQSVLSEEPSLIIMHQPFTYERRTFTPVGRVRYSYGRSFWEEWYVIDSNSNGYWLSVDDGDYILEKEVKFSLALYAYKDLHLHQKIKEWRVTELGEGTCLGYEGELPEVLEIGETHHYAHLSKANGDMITVEFFGKTKKLYQGSWLDPYEIRKALRG